jgi:hypothetical protein
MRRSLLYPAAPLQRLMRAILVMWGKQPFLRSGRARKHGHHPVDLLLRVAAIGAWRGSDDLKIKSVPVHDKEGPRAHGFQNVRQLINSV